LMKPSFPVPCGETSHWFPTTWNREYHILSLIFGQQSAAHSTSDHFLGKRWVSDGATVAHGNRH